MPSFLALFLNQYYVMILYFGSVHLLAVKVPTYSNIIYKY